MPFLPPNQQKSSKKQKPLAIYYSIGIVYNISGIQSTRGNHAPISDLFSLESCRVPTGLPTTGAGYVFCCRFFYLLLAETVYSQDGVWSLFAGRGLALVFLLNFIAHGSFSRIRQVAPMCTPSNSVVPWPHASLHPKLHLDRFIRFCGTH